MSKTRNPVAKHSPTYNRSAVYKDKKREMKKKGYQKREQGSPFLIGCVFEPNTFSTPCDDQLSFSK